jgi:DNA-binding NtrC family response regulator
VISSGFHRKSQFGDLEAISDAMRETFALLARLAPTDVTLLLSGETGTGKGRLARAIHASSRRGGGPYVAFDCSAAAPDVVEEALFGQEGGSAAATFEARPGAIEQAHAGTLLLDEIAAIPLEVQPRLFRALETRVVRRLGATLERAVDVRVVATTSRDLRALVAERTFNEELYFFVSAAVVPVPPLRARLEDLTLLVPELLQTLGHSEVKVDHVALDALRAERWPGNIRQLKNALSCALSFAEGGMLRKSHLKLSLPEVDDSDLERLPLGGRPLADIERAAILQTLRLHGGMKGRAARSLGIAVSTLYDKLKKYGI